MKSKKLAKRYVGNPRGGGGDYGVNRRNWRKDT